MASEQQWARTDLSCFRCDGYVCRYFAIVDVTVVCVVFACGLCDVVCVLVAAVAAEGGVAGSFACFVQPYMFLQCVQLSMHRLCMGVCSHMLPR
jgi:hypothetical protein